MKATRLAIPDVILFEPRVFGDDRGFFFESYNQRAFEEACGHPVSFVQDQSIAVACAATGMVGKESDLFRFTLKHSLIFAALVGLITLAQAYLFTGMLVH